MASNRHERRRDHAIHARRTKKDRPSYTPDRPTKAQTPTPAKGEAIRHSRNSMHSKRRPGRASWLRRRSKRAWATFAAVALGPPGVIYGPTVLQTLLGLATAAPAPPAAPVQSPPPVMNNIIVIPFIFMPPAPQQTAPPATPSMM